MKKILVVEDDESIREGLVDLLRSEDYEVEVAADGHEGMAKSQEKNADLVLLDIMLPGPDGYSILKAMRAENIKTPVILLTARGQEVDKVLGFNFGADDYVVKPFSGRELLLRIKARLKDKPKSTAKKYTFEHVELDMIASKLLIDGKEVDATAMEKDLLEFFILHEGEAVSRDLLLKEVWKFEHKISTRTVDAHVFSLRKKIEKDPKNPQFIQSIRNVGYRFHKDFN
jgi:two-component system alkaline phosphatase synthesis response regulator PhoP